MLPMPLIYNMRPELSRRPAVRRVLYLSARKRYLVSAFHTAEAFRHRCGAWSSKPVGGGNVPCRFDSYTLPPAEIPFCPVKFCAGSRTYFLLPCLAALTAKKRLLLAAGFFVLVPLLPGLLLLLFFQHTAEKTAASAPILPVTGRNGFNQKHRSGNGYAYKYETQHFLYPLGSRPRR